MTEVTIFDPRHCALGEGPLWHLERHQLFWFDILGKKLLSEGAEWTFDEHVSAAGWIDRDTLLVASETALLRFDLTTGQSDPITPLEADDPRTRSNDGRADPWGGFWIGTMGKNLEQGLGAIYRFYRGEVRQLFAPITVSNAICFAPDRRHAYFTDTPTRKVMRQRLDAQGWSDGSAEVLIDLSEERLNPDGAVVDSDGCLWIAQWGAGRVARYDADGRFLSAIPCPASQTTCPAFGGVDLRRLFVTSAADGVTEAKGGQTFMIDTEVTGQAEHRVVL
ncbi:SMP-30/gluconolactonase/LRE family protein [Halovulum sp. GXIMD14793]